MPDRGAGAVGGALITTAACRSPGCRSARARAAARGLEAGHYYVGSLPGVVVALALVTVTVRLALPLYQSLATLLLAYVLLFLPRALPVCAPASRRRRSSSRRRRCARPHRRSGAARSTFASPRRAPRPAWRWWRSAITTELTATLMLRPHGTHTLATEFWCSPPSFDYAGAAPYAVVMILLSLPLSLLLHAQSERLAGQ